MSFFFSKVVCDRRQGLYLLQVIELHGDLSEEEVNVRPPLHSADKVWLWNDGRNGEKEQR